MLQFLPYVQIFISLVLIVCILLQNQGSGFSATFGGDFSSFHTKRGFEKFLFVTTVVFGALFIGNALLTLVLTSKA